ncbi:hypothetical protein CI238_04646, partial [Colletotrichum incanum]
LPSKSKTRGERECEPRCMATGDFLTLISAQASPTWCVLVILYQLRTRPPHSGTFCRPCRALFALDSPTLDGLRFPSEFLWIPPSSLSHTLSSLKRDHTGSPRPSAPSIETLQPVPTDVHDEPSRPKPCLS